MTARTCLDCPATISRFSAGRCRTCAARRVNGDAALVARRSDAIRAKCGAPPRPMPSDFATFAPGKSETLLMRHYVAGRNLVRKWRQTVGIVPNHSGAEIAIPPEFAELAPTSANNVLAARFGVCGKTIKRWREKLSIPRQVKAKLATAKQPRALPTDTLVIKQNSRVVQQQTRNNRVPPPDRSSAEARAADVLRRLASTYRCDEAGRMNPRGQFWRHGNVVLTVDDMMQRAERHGWQEAA